jgi:hypothetical protein
MLGVRRERVVRVVTAHKSYAGEERRFLGSSAAASCGIAAAMASALQPLVKEVQRWPTKSALTAVS